MTQTTIGSYQVLAKLGASKRFQAFSASQRGPGSAHRGTLYVMTDELAEPDLFIETVGAIRAAWPFARGADREVVLPEPQLYKGRPWFFVPESLPLAASVSGFGRAAFASLREQLRWLEEFEAPGGERRFAHGDLRKRRMALLDAEHPLLIAPGWVAASDYARGRGLAHVRGDDAWHFGKLWLQESDRSFVPEGVAAGSDAARAPARAPTLGQAPPAARVAVPPPPPEARGLEQRRAEQEVPTVPPPRLEPLEEPAEGASTAPPPPLPPARPLPPQPAEARAVTRPGGPPPGPPPFAAAPKPAGATPPPWPPTPAPAAREAAAAPERAARSLPPSLPPSQPPARPAPPAFVSSRPPAAAAPPPFSAPPPGSQPAPAPASQPSVAPRSQPSAAPRSGAQPALIAALIVALALLVALLVAVWM